MAIICIITGILELLLLVTITGVLVTFAALFSLLEFTLMSINPVVLYLVRQSGQLLTFSIILMVRLVHHVTSKMCPSSISEPDQNSIIATIEPFPTDIEISPQTPLTPEDLANNDVVFVQQNSEQNDDDVILDEINEIQINNSNQDE